ncbi:MAG TPA: MarR family transcriptional regulator [Tepidisphaeraceae bacterium]|nr:MarR family transcriptional regulator [Tepidisphaeraceae bacterium]
MKTGDRDSGTCSHSKSLVLRAPIQQEAFLAILSAADALAAELEAVLKEFDLSATQYNVLRILRGAGDEGLPCGRIAERMITRDPDMTRLLDRLEKRGLIERSRDANDRRVVRGRISPAGLRAVAALDEPVIDLHRRQLQGLNKSQMNQLVELLHKTIERND